MKTGIIYLFRNTVNNKVYVGQTTYKLRHRWNKHLLDVKNGSTLLFHVAIRKYSPARFSHEILETLPEPQLNDAEIKWIAHYDSFRNRTKGYNLTEGGGGIRGMHHSEDAKRRISESHSGDNHYLFGKKQPESVKKLISAAHIGKPKSEETKANMSKAQKGHAVSDEQRERLRSYGIGNTYRLGKSHTEETKKKISESKLGSTWSEEARVNHLAGVARGEDHPYFGKQLSEETRKKMSEAKIGTTHSQEVKDAISKFHKGRKRSPETVERLRQAAKNRPPRKPHSEETKEKMRAAQSVRRAKEAV